MVNNFTLIILHPFQRFCTKKGDFLEESPAVNRTVGIISNISSQLISMLSTTKLHIYFDTPKLINI